MADRPTRVDLGGPPGSSLKQDESGRLRQIGDFLELGEDFRLELCEVSIHTSLRAATKLVEELLAPARG